MNNLTTQTGKEYRRELDRAVNVVRRLFLARDPDQLADIVRHEAHTLTGADGSAFVLREGDGHPDQGTLAAPRERPCPPMDKCVGALAMKQGQPVLIEDLSDDPRVPAEAYRSTRVKGLLMVPICPSDPVGAIGSYWADKHRPTDEEVRLLTMLAESAALALANIRRDSALERRIRELTEALAASEARLGHVTEAAELGGWDWDVAADRLECSPRCLAIFGIPVAGPVSYAGFLATIHPDDRERIYAAVHAALAGDGEYDIEYRRPLPDGRVGWVGARGRVSFGPDGRPLRLGGIAVDITRRKEMEAALRDSEARFHDMADAAPAMLWVTGADGACGFLSRDWYEFTGQARGAGPDGGWLDALHPEDREAVAEQCRTANSRREPFTHECRLLRADGLYRWVSWQGRPRLAPDGAFLGHVGSVVDIDERKRAEQRIREAALHDPLTGLPNRALIFEYGARQLAAAQRRHGGTALLIVVLRRFKIINDRHGHETGDDVLKEVAKRLGECTRREDLVGRLGCEEFVILLPHMDDDGQRAAIVARHVLERVSQPMQVGGHSLIVTSSIGISCYPEHGADMDALVRAAGLATDKARQSGRTNYRFYSRDLERHAEEALELETRLRNALKNGGFVVHYQPVIDIRSGRLIAAEALVRLMGDGGETIPPLRFIRIAESLGLIGELDEWVAATACRQHGAWLEQGLPPVSIAVNSSALQFRQRGFPERLGRIISESGIDPAHFQLELTENTLQTGTNDVMATLGRIKSLGVKIALDEFGTGETNLSLLSRLPLDMLKINPAFVQGIDYDDSSLVVTRSIIELGHHLDLEVVGEGIESEAALNHLRECGCNRAQGFLVSRPLPAREFAHWCKQRVH
jgi:diguanylate cyclase (GGDEF)-like protein/PAS domain S-box-containing protein